MEGLLHRASERSGSSFWRSESAKDSPASAGIKHRRQLGKASEERDNLSPHDWGLLPPLPDPLKTDNPSLLLILIFSPSWKPPSAAVP